MVKMFYHLKFTPLLRLRAIGDAIGVFAFIAQPRRSLHSDYPTERVVNRENGNTIFHVKYWAVVTADFGSVIYVYLELRSIY